MWKDVVGYEDTYKISDLGEVWSKDRMCVDSKGRKRFRKGVKIKPDIAQNGYYRVTLAKNGKKKQKYLHRLLAEHFIDNPLNLPQVNHKDGNKLNYKVENLEWVSVQNNVIHAYHPNYGKRGNESKRAKQVMAINVTTGEAKIYGSMIETKRWFFTIRSIKTLQSWRRTSRICI